MLRVICLAAVLALGALAPPALGAQELAELCRVISDMKVGQWSSYNVSGDKSPGQLRFAVVGSDRSGDSSFLWFEMRFVGQDPSRNAIMQLLVPSLGGRATSIHALVMKVGNQPAMKMSGPMVGMMGQRMSQNNYALDWGKHCASAQVVGWESVTVPAGTLRALHTKPQEGGDAWASRDVPFGLVKVHSNDGTEMVLTGHGSDAKSSITEQPQEMPMPGMMRKP